MEKITKLLNKYWVVVSIISTIVSSGVMWAFHVKARIDSVMDKVNDTASWVQDHDDAIQMQHDDILKLKEDERLREAGLLK